MTTERIPAPAGPPAKRATVEHDSPTARKKVKGLKVDHDKRPSS
jgi:hypothetical protein